MAWAETIKDAVRKHVAEGLEGSPKEDKPQAGAQAKPAASGTPMPAQVPGAARSAPPHPVPAVSASTAPPVAPRSLTASPRPAASGSVPPPALATQPRPSPANAGTTGFYWSTEAKPESNQPETPKPAGPEIPQRVFGKYFKLDPKLGGGLRGWIPAQYPTVKVTADTYYTWSMDVSAQLFRYVNLHRGYYESNGIAGPWHQGAAVAVQAMGYAKKAAWLLGIVGVPITRTWEPVVIYESRAFHTRATPSQPVRIVPFNTPPDTDLSTIPTTTEPLTLVSGFETFVVGMRYNQSGEPPTLGQRRTTLPPFYFGLGFTEYSKPYQVTVGNSVLDSVLFDARFRGAGLALGVNVPGKPDYLILDASVQIGLGQVRLLDKLTLNELLPNTPGNGGLQTPEWVIGYTEGNLSVGYLYTLLRTQPSVLVSAVASGGGARFYYIKTRSGEGEQVNMPSLNWDFLWGLMGYVTVPL